jgi:hypothetical protein
MDTADRQLRVMIDSIPALVWAARQMIRGVLQSPLACDYSDSSGDQASDWGWMKIIHAEDLTRLMEHYRFVVASGELGEMAVRFRRFGGEYRCFLLRASPLFNESGVVEWGPPDGWE